MARPLPVLHGEGVECEDFNARFRAGGRDGADGIDTCLMAKYAWVTSLAGPAAIAVHYDRDVRWQALRIQLSCQAPVRLAWLQHLKQIFHDYKRPWYDSNTDLLAEHKWRDGGPEAQKCAEWKAGRADASALDNGVSKTAD